MSLPRLESWSGEGPRLFAGALILVTLALPTSVGRHGRPETARGYQPTMMTSTRRPRGGGWRSGSGEKR